MKRCEYCKKLPLIEDDETCCRTCFGTEVDTAVRLRPTKRARCGHVSFNYFACSLCKTNDADSVKDLWDTFTQLRTWDPVKGEYKKRVGRRGDALRNFPKLPTGRGYYWDAVNKNYQVSFRNKYVGRANTAGEAREMYLKAVNDYRLFKEKQK